MRISTKAASILAITSILLTAVPAQARPGRWGGYGGYRGGGHAWHGHAYSNPRGVQRYGSYFRYYRGYSGYYPGYYGHYHGNGDNVAIAVGAGLLGVMLGTALSSRNRGYNDRGRGQYYEGRSYDRAYDRRDIPTYDGDDGRYGGLDYDSPRYYDKDGNYDPYRYYRDGGDFDASPGTDESYDSETDGDTDYGAVGM